MAWTTDHLPSQYVSVVVAQGFRDLPPRMRRQRADRSLRTQGLLWVVVQLRLRLEHWTSTTADAKAAGLPHRMTVPAAPPSLPSSSAAKENRGDSGVRLAVVWIGVVALTALTAALLTGSTPSMPAARSMMVGSFTLLAGTCLLPSLVRGDHAGRGPRWAARLFAASGSVMALAYFVAWANAVLPNGNLELSTYGLLIKNFTVGKALVAAMVIGVLYVLVDTISGRRGGSWSGHLGIMAALAATLPVSLAGHAAHGSSTFSDLMVLTMIGHVFGAMCWVGGLAALGGWHLTTRGDLSEALPRFSRVAATCIAIVAVTGIVNGAVILVD